MTDDPNAMHPASVEAAEALADEVRAGIAAMAVTRIEVPQWIEGESNESRDERWKMAREVVFDLDRLNDGVPLEHLMPPEL